MVTPSDITPRDRIRFEKKFCIDPDTGCWIWTGGKVGNTRRLSYGKFHIKGHPHQRAHRISWMIYKGPIPDRLDVLHNCPAGDNPSCVNPDHLWTGTDKENRWDCVNKGRNNPPIGDRNGLRKHPELIRRGEDHWTKQRPDLIRRGSEHGCSKFTQEEAQLIRARYADGGVTSRSLAKEYGTCKSTILNVIHESYY
jgi:hypothetical protein